jgi:hypothetical protein
VRTVVLLSHAFSGTSNYSTVLISSQKVSGTTKPM